MRDRSSVVADSSSLAGVLGVSQAVVGSARALDYLQNCRGTGYIRKNASVWQACPGCAAGRCWE